MKKSQTKTITFGASMVAIFVILYSIFATTDEIVQEALGLITILPIAIFVKQYGVKSGIIALVSCIILSMFLVQPTVFVIYAIPSAIIGTILGAFIGKTNTFVSVGILSGLNVVRLIYELYMSSIFFNTDFRAEYIKIVDEFTESIFVIGFPNNLILLFHDMVLYSIPVIFILGAIAKAGLAYLIIGVIIKRILKDNFIISIPKIKENDLLFSHLFLVIFVTVIVIISLLSTDILTYNKLYAVYINTILVLMYVYLVYCLRNLVPVFNLNKKPPLYIVFLLILFFPITDLIFSIKCLFNIIELKRIEKWK